jgi:hypothetical protein
MPTPGGGICFEEERPKAENGPSEAQRKGRNGGAKKCQNDISHRRPGPKKGGCDVEGEFTVKPGHRRVNVAERFLGEPGGSWMGQGTSENRGRLRRQSGEKATASSQWN